MVHPGGRPRSHDREFLAKEILIWVEKPGARSLNQFCWDYKMAPSMLFKLAKDSNEFGKALELAKSRLAEIREELVRKTELDRDNYRRTMHVYDQFLRHEDRDQLAYEIDLKSKAELATSPLQDHIDNSHELMLLKAENEKLKALLNDNKREAE